MLRYVPENGALRTQLLVVKTRATDHDRGAYFIEIAKGGMRIGEKLDVVTATEPKPPKGRPESRRAKRSRTR
jgi:KaiC/GvpD/RAD55 family RecA-like ATPase